MNACMFCKADIQEQAELCFKCLKLKAAIYSDVELAEQVLRSALQERAERSPLGLDLRDAIIGYVGKLQAEEAANEGEEVLAWVDVLVDGVRGLAYYSDEELLEEFHGALNWDDQDESVLGEFATRLRDSDLWKKVCSEIDVRKESSTE